MPHETDNNVTFKPEAYFEIGGQLYGLDEDAVFTSNRRERSLRRDAKIARVTKLLKEVEYKPTQQDLERILNILAD